ncbi:DUF349 domain-containing protein [Nitrincola tapanii]|uniref:DUF349 domain-containing protein n=1 Tax=Nitrincola tapanii TaxID=1708751 RepID=A0A5A9W0M4_9GAMM|nr:DUF349 domain-containing protein [Nitrincola tapanii]KAA0874112.1 DUF349 domain-containing protein [Nitrincola tapanii]
MFAFLFRPKWRHPNPEVRLQAVEQLNPTENDDLQRLRHIALHDSDQRVRCRAIEQLESLSLLLELLEQQLKSASAEPPAPLLNSLASRLQARQAQAAAEWTHWLNLAQEEELLTLLLHSNAAELHPQLLAQIQNPQALAQIAVQAPLTLTRQAAASRLSDPELLEWINRQTRDKQVYRITRERLTRLQEEAAKTVQRYQQCQQLHERLAQLLQGRDQTHFCARLQPLLDVWQTLKADCPAPLAEQIEALCQHAQGQAQALEAARQQEEAQVLEQQRLQAQGQKALSQLSREAEQLAHKLAEAPWQPELSESYQTWREAAEHLIQSPVGQHLDLSPLQHFAPLLQQLLKSRQQLLNLIQDFPQLSETLSHPSLHPGLSSAEQLNRQTQRLQQALEHLPWPQAFPPPPELNLLQQRLQDWQELIDLQQAQTQQRLQEFDQALRAVEQPLQTGQLNPALTAWEVLNAQLNAESIALERLPKTYLQRYQTLEGQLQELQAWQNFALMRAKEALCEAMETLAEHTELAPPALADEIKRLQSQWKALDQQDHQHSRALWQRFQKAGQNAYQQCEAYFRQQAEQRHWNLAQRQEICGQLQRYLEAFNPQTPGCWQALDEILRCAKQEWRTYSPVDRAPGKALQHEFNRLLSEAEAGLDQHRHACALAKRALVARAQALCDWENRQEAMTEMKAIQREWKTLGTTFREEESKLWKRLRQCSDQIFQTSKPATSDAENPNV